MKKTTGSRGARGARRSRGARGSVSIVSKVRRTKQQAYGSRESWEEMRMAVIRRDGCRCTRCRSTEDLTVDHIIPVAQGGRTVMSNLRTLCVDCHSKQLRHAKVAKLLKAGRDYRKKKKRK